MCALVTGVQTCALPIYVEDAEDVAQPDCANQEARRIAAQPARRQVKGDREQRRDRDQDRNRKGRCAANRVHGSAEPARRARAHPSLLISFTTTAMPESAAAATSPSSRYIQGLGAGGRTGACASAIARAPLVSVPFRAGAWRSLPDKGKGR